MYLHTECNDDQTLMDPLYGRIHQMLQRCQFLLHVAQRLLFDPRSFGPFSQEGESQYMAPNIQR